MELAWCNICNSRPSEGKLTVLVNDIAEDIDACTVCVHDPKKVEFI